MRVLLYTLFFHLLQICRVHFTINTGIFNPIALLNTPWAQSTSAVKIGDNISADNTNKCPGYDSKQTDGGDQVLELWELWNTPSLELIPGPIWPRVVVSVRVQSMGQIELFTPLAVCKKYDWC